MHFLPQPLRGPAFMVAATGAFVINDTMMKLATEGIPPLQVLFMRGIAATLWCFPLVLILGYGKDLPKLVDKWVLLRNFFEFLAVMMFVIALANMPIADATALGQVTPLLFLIGMSVIMREKIGGVRMALIGLGFVGALMVAQPSGAGISGYALLALGNAVFCAARDIAGRKVGDEVPGWILAMCAILMVMVGAGTVSAFTETWVMPDLREIALLVGSGLFLMFGHFCIFTSFRVGDAASVAPFYYMFSVWALISGIVVFGYFPNALAITGIGFILAGGIAIVLLDDRKRRLAVPVA
jgi:drug/metabolite transporter (DMT)-like permease